MLNLKKTKSLSSIAREWDAIAALRDDQVSSGKDHSANFVLAPAILKQLEEVDSLIDIGCGTGWLTERAEKYVSTAIGIDPSQKSIALARLRHPGRAIDYVVESVESYTRKHKKFELAISNMALSCAPNVHTFLVSARGLLKKGAMFVFTVPHPCFWPLYWGYASHPKFDYQRSFAVEGEFKIRKEVSGLLTTHFHHPLEAYLTGLVAAGFIVESLNELTGRGFDFPRFLLIKARAA